MHTAPCQKCNGTGRLNWTQVDGGMCWACGGNGAYATATAPDVLAKRRASAREKRAAATAEQVEAGLRAGAERESRYTADPRIGPETRARIAQFPMVGFEVYRLLALVDGGQSLPHVLRNVAA